MITGKDIYEALFPNEHSTLLWETLASGTQRPYADAARELNTQHITPLQELVRDWRLIMQEHDELPCNGPLDEYQLWDESYEQLKARTRELLGEETKS